MREIDVSGWAVIRDEPGGRDPDKRWLAVDADAPREAHWLWKSRQTTGDGSDRALTDVAEVVSSRLSGALGLPAAECHYAICDGQVGVLSRNISPTRRRCSRSSRCASWTRAAPTKPRPWSAWGPREAGPFEVLGVSGGSRTGDTYELTPLPEPGHVDMLFLVHGVRYLEPEERAAIDDLPPGMQLTLRCEPHNPVNPRALLVNTAGTRLGYVPDPLLEYVHVIMAKDHELRVERVNPASAGLHMRLLVR
ncbi:MAG: HIRAN domain-containing protein, partial [Dermatophilaceae bacterium]